MNEDERKTFMIDPKEIDWYLTIRQYAYGI